ncbi:MAG: hypothetical protein KIS67_29020 [Verrucomicrobiae bacterium]|nr:hypothetical protein [Verrucomicrobiae bacterium]
MTEQCELNHYHDLPDESTVDRTGRRNTRGRIIGEGHLVKAFQYAHEDDSEADLHYSDYLLAD